jgi:glucose-6-phosphate 1-dehydrogenase
MAELIPVEAFDLIIFGGNGDLASRKLLPALFHRFCDGQITNDSRIIGVGREELDQAAFIGNLKQAFETINPLAVDEKFQPFSALIDYVQLDALDHGSWQKLVERLKGHEHKATTVYLATHPTLFGSIANGLSNNGLIHDQMRIVLEKPVGHDYESASNINDEVGTCFRESQVFRIDHYLGKETVQNLLALRFGNSLFEPLWRREVIDHVQITVAEDLGVESRLDFYDRTGALRDMVQNHLMQLVCLVAMEPPSSSKMESLYRPRPLSPLSSR